jgi:predicted amidohydrolase YtcJ
LAFLNAAGVRALKYSKETKYPGGEVVLDANGNATGLLLAKPSALILYSTLALLPRLNADEQQNSTQWFYREMNRLGLTSAIDPGGGGQGSLTTHSPRRLRTLNAMFVVVFLFLLQRFLLTTRSQ